VGTMDALQVDPSNAEQLKAWDGDEGAYWAAHPLHFDRSLAAYHGAFMDAALLRPNDRVLDVGCGNGQLARDAARLATEGSVLGVDLSSAMLDVARRQTRSEGLTNVEFAQADVQVHPFEPASYDVVLGRTVAMFFGDKPAAFRNLARALRTGGRMLLLTWQGPAENQWIREFSAAMAAGRDISPPPPSPEVPGPFSLSDPDVIRGLLTGIGFVDIAVTGSSEAMWFGDDIDDAFDFVSGLLGWMLEGLDLDGRAVALDALRDTIAAHQTPEGVLYPSATWTITAAKP
jgi:SAM-dependent methyltransferase